MYTMMVCGSGKYHFDIFVDICTYFLHGLRGFRQPADGAGVPRGGWQRREGEGECGCKAGLWLFWGRDDDHGEQRMWMKTMGNGGMPAKGD